MGCCSNPQWNRRGTSIWPGDQVAQEESKEGLKAVTAVSQACGCVEPLPGQGCSSGCSNR